MTDRFPDVTVTSLSRLSTGYWQVRFGRERFVQWPVDRVPTADDVFHGDKHADILALAALAATDKVRATEIRVRLVDTDDDADCYGGTVNG